MDLAAPCLAACKNMFERLLDGPWRDAKGVEPRHPRRNYGVCFHEFHLVAAEGCSRRHLGDPRKDMPEGKWHRRQDRAFPKPIRDLR